MKRFAKLILIIGAFLILLAFPYKVSAEKKDLLTETDQIGQQGENPVDGDNKQSGLSFSEIYNKGKNFIKNGEGQEKDLNATALVSGLADILTTIGVVVVLAGLLIIGIKYMTATPEEAAKLKSKLVGLAIAGIVIIGAFGIWKLVGTFLENITK